MGSLLKLVLTFVIIYWLFKTVGKFFFNTFANKENQQRRYQGQQNRNTKTGNVHVDHNPNSNKTPHDFKGGEYVDYEEVE